jgi:O-antigen/teichoic acid export membrane protein
LPLNQIYNVLISAGITFIVGLLLVQNNTTHVFFGPDEQKFHNSELILIIFGVFIASYFVVRLITKDMNKKKKDEEEENVLDI